MKIVNVRSWWALIGICLLAFTLFLDVGIVANALPAIQKSFNANAVQTQWLISAFMLALCVFMTIMGRLGDIFGLRKVFYINIFLFSLASLGAGLSQHINELIFFRALQGITAAAAPLSAALVTHNFLPEKHAKAIAIFSMITGAGLALGPVLGGILIVTLGWRWVFFINIPISLIGLYICMKTVIEAEKPFPRESFDGVGAALLITGLSSLVIVLMQGSSWGWLSIPSLTSIGIAIISLPAFMLVELHKLQPLLNFQWLGNRIFIAAAFASLIFGVFMATLLFLNPLYLQNTLSLSASTAGMLLFIVSGMVVITGPLAGWISRHFGNQIGIVLVLLLTLCSAIAHSFFTPNFHIGLIILAFMTFGMAWGFLNIAPVLAVTGLVESKNTGAIMGMLWTFLNVGTSVGLAVTGIVFRSGHTFMHGFHLTAISLVGISAVALVIIIFSLRHPSVVFLHWK